MTRSTGDTATREVPVWDLFVRVGHWAIVIAFAVAYLTEGEPLVVHVWAGYVIAALVVLRVIWGFVGPRHARFADFLYGPGRVIDYLVKLIGFRAERHLGHSPAGGAMVIALLLLLAATTLSGMATLADTKGEGPLAPWISQSITESAAPAVEVEGRDDDEEHERRRGPRSDYEEIHELFVNLTLLLVILHIGGVVLASIAHREKLVKAMITGRKRPL